MRQTTNPMALALTMGMLAVMGGLGVAAAQAAPPRVTNGDFERGMANWQGGGQISQEVAHGGGTSLLLEDGSVYQPPGSHHLIPIDPDYDYRVSVWIKTDGVSESGATLTAVSRGGANPGESKWLGGWIKGVDPKFVHDGGASPAIIATGGTHDWQPFTVGIPGEQLHKQAQWLSLYLRHDAHKPAQGKAWFDDITVERLPQGTVKIKPREHLVLNGGFEDGKRGWGGSGEIVADPSSQGGHAMKVPGGHALQMNIPVEGGAHYRVSMQVRTEGVTGEPGYVQYSFRGGRGVGGWHGPIRLDKGNHNEPALFITTRPTRAWQAFSAVIRAPKKADQLLVYLRKDGGPGAVYFDEVSVKKTDEPLTDPGELRAKGMAPAEPMVSDTDFATAELTNTSFEQGAESWVMKGASEVSDGVIELINGRALQGKKVDDKKNYRVSVRIKTAAAAPDNASMRLQFRGPRTLKRADEWAVPIATGGTHDWQTFEAVVAVPRTATDMLVYLDKDVDDGTAWFDNVSVEATDAKPTPTGKQQREAALAKLLPTGAGINAQAALASIVAQAPAAEAAAPLAENGTANYAIHVGSADDPIVLHAAEELADYLGRITGADFTPLSTDANPIDKPLIVVGRNNALTDKLAPRIPYNELGGDGFVFRTVGPNLVITGAQPRGTLYGVYWLLDRKLGVKWLSPVYTIVPENASPALGPLDEQHVPRFTYREVFNRDTDDGDWRQHNLLNGNSHHRSFRHYADGIDTWSQYWPKGGHNFHRIVSHKKYGKQHPEWFAGGQLAMMNEDVRRVAAEQLTKLIANEVNKGRDPSYAMSQEDRGWAPDAKSRAFAKAHGGTLAAPNLDMVSGVAARVREAIPDARLATLAYHWSFPPPTGMTAPEYVVITVAPIEANFAQPFTGPDNQARTGAGIAGWADIAQNIVIWDYITNFGNYIQPFPNIEPMAKNIQWLATMPAVQGYFGQGGYSSVGVPFAELRGWVAARLLWDPSLDPRPLIESYVRGYFGDAAPYVQQYIDLLRQSAEQHDAVLTIRTPITADYLSFDAMRQADELFEKAAATVKGQPGFERRVATARLGVDAVILLRRAEYAYLAEQRGIEWDPHTEARLARFAGAIDASGMNTYGEGVGRVGNLLDAMRVERKMPQPPAEVAGLSEDDWRDYQDMDLRLYRGRVVGDPLASDGGALRMKGDNPAWGIQMKLDYLPTDGKWKLYAVVRVDPGRGAGEGGEARAMTLGVFPGWQRTVKLGELADGKYHVIEMDGTYRHNPGQAVFFAPPNSKAIEYMYVDRVIAVRAE